MKETEVNKKMQELYNAYLPEEEAYISRSEAAKILSVSTPRVTQMVNEGKLTQEVNPENGKLMFRKDEVLAYSKYFIPGSKRLYVNCINCGKSFPRLISKKTDQNANKLLKTDLCSTCRKQTTLNLLEHKSSYVPHSGGQLDVHNSTARYRLLSCGARWGKDRCSINEFIRLFAEMLSENRNDEMIPQVHGWLVAPTFPMANQLWRELKAFFPRRWIRDKYEGDKTIFTVDDGIIEVKSADDPNALVAVGLDLVLITEASRIKNLEEVWANLSIRVQSPGRGPNGSGGIILANSTPTGRNYWYELVKMGRKKDPSYDPDFESFEHPTADNPYIRPEEIVKARRRLADRTFRQEYLAEFIDSADAVFTSVDECATYQGGDTPELSEVYLLAWDPAKSADFSAWGVRNSKGELVTCGRWTGVPWAQQLDRIAQISAKYNYAQIIVDQTGLGQPMPEALMQRGLDVDPVLFTAANKEQMVNNLAFLMEQGAISYPKVDYLIQELKDYKYTTSASGTVRYSAPKNAHDDMVSMMMMLYKDFHDTEIVIPFFGVLLGVDIGSASREPALNFR